MASKSPVWLTPPYPTNPNEIPVPPEPTDIPTVISDLTDPMLLEMAVLLKLACGRSVTPLKTPKRYLLCVLATILDYEYERRHPK